MKYLEVTVTIIKNIYENDEDIATLANNMASIYQDKGEYEKAEYYSQKAVDI